jgi:hypothetical protein
MPESEVLITTEVTLSMIVFALVNVALMSGRIFAAWSDRRKGSPS